MTQQESINLHSICERIRSNKLLIDSEIDCVHKYEEDVSDAKVKLCVKGWVCFQHQLIVDRLVTHHPQLKTTDACQLCEQLNGVSVLPAYRTFGHHYSTIARALCVLLHNPAATADLLHNSEQNTEISCEDACNAIFSGVFTTLVYPNDEKALLDTVYELMQTQLLHASDARLVLRRGTSAACRMYKHFTESLFSVKVFLTSAFHEAVMRVLCQDENFLDIDPSKSELRIKASEKERVFGADPTSEKYQVNLTNHRLKIVERLVLLTNEFLKGISDSLPYFPTALINLVQNVFKVLVHKKNLPESEAELICMDLIITNLFCPAITNPEKVGIVSDIPVGHIARFNLMQVAQIVQVLAFKKFEIPHPNHQIFMVQFEQSNMHEIVRHLIDVDISKVAARENKSLHNLKKSHFVASIQEVKTIVKMIEASGRTENEVLNKLHVHCKKVFNSLNSLSPPTEKKEIPRSSTLKSLTQRVSFLGSFKKSSDEVESAGGKIYQNDFFELALFDYNENDAQPPEVKKVKPQTPEPEVVEDGNNLIDFEEPEIQVVDLVETSEEKILDGFYEGSPKSDFAKGIEILKRVGDKMKIRGSPSAPLVHSSTMSELAAKRPQLDLLTSSSSESNLAGGKMSADAILAKYTNKRPEAQATPLTSYDYQEESPEEEYFSPINLTSCRAFTDTLRKLRTVLGKVSHLPQLSFSSSINQKLVDKKEELTCLLQGLLAEMVFGRQDTLASHVREVLRCINFFDTLQIEVLLNFLEKDHENRCAELVLLQNTRLKLMTTMAQIAELRRRLDLVEKLHEESLVDLLTWSYTKAADEENALHTFLRDFVGLKAQDERAESVKGMLHHLCSVMPTHPVWRNAPESIELCARRAIERHVMGYIYSCSFFPNMDADRLRDRLFQESVSTLAMTITPTHPHIHIPRKLLGEAPWPSAQVQITVINAYKSALDKLACIVRCCDAINNLVALSSEGNVAAADDLTPVLVYVIIQGNPPNILSNLQYISTFAGDHLKEGKEAYFYTLFKAAVEYIKTLL